MENYEDITSHLDARDILRYLNYLGIYNISGEVLKYFITDLKKLIKYDLQQSSVSSNNIEKHEGLERLHAASTFSSRSRSKGFTEKSMCVCSKGHVRGRVIRQSLTMRNIQSAPALGKKPEEKQPQRACSCVRMERKIEITKESSKATTILSENLIKVPKVQVKKKCDPVTLYHYYSSLWAKYKPNVPGENDWADIRWRIRQKMVGIEVQPCTKAPSKKNHDGNQMKKQKN